MDLIEKIKQIFGKGASDEAIQSDSKRSNERFKAIQSASNFTTYGKKDDEAYANRSVSGLTELSQPLELQKESLQLGVAAGYTGKSIREIESSLVRIEQQMASKDWFTYNFEDQTPKLVEILNEIKTALEKHDSNALKRFEAIESALNRMSTAAGAAPEPIRKELFKEIESIKSNLPITHKMEQLLAVAKESGKISYDDMAAKLGVSISSLRGLLSNTIKRTDEIERFSIGNKGWVRYKYPKTTQLSSLQID